MLVRLVKAAPQFCLWCPSREVSSLAEVSSSFIHQRSSRSVLSISLPLFLALLKTYGISEQLLDFICCFGYLNGERELGPPPVRFRWHVQGQLGSPIDFVRFDFFRSQL